MAYPPDPVEKRGKKPEKRQIAVIDGIRWRCPFCERDNGIPERPVCACGAEREDEVATLGA